MAAPSGPATLKAATARPQALPASLRPSATAGRWALSVRVSRYAYRRPMRQPSREHSLGDGAELVHGACVALGRGAALIRGPSGSGKSDLALRFLFLARRGPAALEAPVLVADDQVRLVSDGKRILASAPEAIRGRIEVRGVGIVALKSIPEAELVLVVDLVDSGETERLPGTDARVRILDIDLPLLRLAPLENSAPIKLAIALAHAGRS